MQRRISHNKSRRGCQSCKQRHIKCDEQGPPCANCVARNTSCVYPTGSSRSSSRSNSVPRTSPLRHLTPRERLSNSSPTASDRHRLLELELMHRWTARTYVSFCSTPPELPVMQNTIPREALKHDCLMSGILALSALDLAVSTEETKSAQYVRAALEYYGRAISSFRGQLTNLTEENSGILFLLSTMMAAINLAMLRCPNSSGEQQSFLDRIPTVFNILIGSNSIVFLYWRWILDSPLQLRVAMSYGKASRDLVSPDDREALRRLARINDRFYLPPSRGEPVAWDETQSGYDMCQDAIFHLEYCFAEDARAKIRSFCVAFAVQTGTGFTRAIVESEPMALLILMHWAVLLERLGMENWWATTAGANLILETSRKLEASPITLIPEVPEAMLWARRQVGLPKMGWTVTSSPDG